MTVACLFFLLGLARPSVGRPERPCAACIDWAQRGGRYPVCPPAVAVGAARQLRCDAQRTRAAAMPLAATLNAPLLHGFSPVRPWRAGLPLVLLRFSPRHKSSTPGTTHRAGTLVFFDDACHGAARKAVVGCAPAATYAGPRSGGFGRLPAAKRAGEDCLSTERSGAAQQRRCRARARSAAAFRIRAPQGTLRAAEGAASEHRRIPGRGFARAVHAQRRTCP
jgi:hypothetical protein